ncbi:MAG: PEGA domain-containing protein [Ignavibacteriales bacterium]|nr:PEGA domain-containing protein [Ignavibacteriales bacterium]
MLKIFSDYLIYHVLFLVIFILFVSCEKEVSVSPPDSPPPKGFVTISSKPQSFKIFMEGKDRRRITPDSITWLETGSYRFTLRKNLFRDTSFSVDVVEGEKKKCFIDFTLNPAMLGSIKIESKPSSSLIFLNDSSTGLQTPTVIKGLLPGYYEVRLRNTDHRDKKILVTVESNKTSEVNSVLVDTTIWNDYTLENSQIASNNLTCLLSDNPQDKIYIGTADMGLVVKENNLFANYNRNNSRVIDINIKSLYKTSGKLWIGTKEKGLARINGLITTFFKKNGSSIPTDNITSAALSEDGKEIYFLHDPATANAGGISVFNPSFVKSFYLNQPSLKTRSIYVDSDKRIWIASSIGIITFKDYPDMKILDSNNTGLNLEQANGITQDGLGNIYFSTYGSGLIKLKADKIEHVVKKN